MLDIRLQTVADYVRRGSRLADIGTDHALLPTFLVEEGRCPSAIASDIRKGPAEAARRTVRESKLEKQIEVRLGDGLSTVRQDEVEDIVIAGMGGETIADILKQAPWVQHPRYRLILQPMTRAERLRRYLFETGFSIEQETVVSDEHHCYTVLCVAYTGQILQPEEALCYVGKISPTDGVAYLKRVCRRLQKQADACPNEEIGLCIQQIHAYLQGEWNPWEVEQ